MKALKGIFPATISPFAEDGRFDAQAMRRIVAYQIDAGVHGLYICGGTGEGLLMKVEERQEALEVVLDEVAGRVAVISHIGAFSTEETIALARHASGTKAAAVAALPPHGSTRSTMRPSCATTGRSPVRRNCPCWYTTSRNARASP